MNYLKELNAFYEWLDTNPLSSGAVVLWYTLMAVNNKTNWKDEFTIANMALQAKTGLSRQQLDRARADLINSGRIKYTKSGRVNKAGKYSIVSFDTQNGHDAEHKAVTERAQNEQKVTTLTKHKLNKTKQKDKEGEEDKRALINPFQFYEQEGFGQLSGFVADKLGSLIDDYGESLVLHAMGEAVLYGARNLKYVESILKNPNKKRGEESGQKVYQHRRSYGRPTSKGKSTDDVYRELEEARRAWGG